MDEVNTNQTPSEESSGMSFTDKVMNVFSAPGELFEGIAKSEKQNSNWAIPLILTMIAGIIFVFVAFSQAPIQDQMREQQEKTFQKQIESGKMTQEQVDRAMSFSPKPGSPIFMAFGAVGVAFVTAAMLFGFALGFWLVGKWVFKAPVVYAKVLEVVGLSMYVSVLGSIITLLLVVAMGSLYATPSLALAVSHFDPSNKVDKLLASINLVTFWYLAVVSVGLGKIFSVTTTKALVAVGVLWAVWTGITVFVGFGM
jgi:hypothetical protein